MCQLLLRQGALLSSGRRSSLPQHAPFSPSHDAAERVVFNRQREPENLEPTARALEGCTSTRSEFRAAHYRPEGGPSDCDRSCCDFRRDDRPGRPLGRVRVQDAIKTLPSLDRARHPFAGAGEQAWQIEHAAREMSPRCDAHAHVGVPGREVET